MKTKLFITFLLPCILFSCHGGGDNPVHEEYEEDTPEGVVFLTERQQKALGLELGTFQMRNLTTVVKTNGQLEVPPAASAEVTAIIGGNAREIKVFHGDRVRKGQALAVLEHPDYIVLQEQFAEIASQLKFLEQEFERQKELYDNNVGSGKEFQRVSSEYNVSRAQYSGLESRLRLLGLSPGNVRKGNISSTITITSPINGFVNDVNIKVGTYVDAKDKLFEITDNSEIHADFMVYEKDIHLLKNGQRIEFTVANHPDQQLRATIFAIGKEFESAARGVHIHARLDDNPGNLVPGMYVSGHIHTDSTYTRALPDDAVVTEGTKSFIFVFDESVEENQERGPVEPDDQEELSHSLAFRMVEVITGKKDEGYTEIKLLSPLAEETRVAMNAAYYLLAELNKAETEHAH